MNFPSANILEVDLSNGTIKKIILDGETHRLYPGGSALGTYILLKELKPKVDSLSPENILVFSVSPFTGLPIAGANRITVTTKSPLTDGIGDSQAGGFFPAYLKGNGWNALVFKGRAEKPVYLYIDGDKVQLRDASKIWGKVTGEAEKLIRKDLGIEDIDIAQIGPGGENLVKFANILNMCNRANGRNGTGAVMGSKNLKAIVVKKKLGLKAADRENFQKLAKKGVERFNDSHGLQQLGEHGTNRGLISHHKNGFLATRNWISGYFPEGAENITGTTMTETILKKRDTCYACPVRCKRVVEIEGKVDPIYGGPEYETAAALGSYCGITNLETVAIANQLCNMYGLDTISCGATISFVMECFEAGLLTKEDTDGLELTFGNDEGLIQLIEKIGKREGIGNLLAEGSYRAAKKIGNGALKYSMTVKKQELPAHMPQYKPSLGLIYAVNPFGADHQSSEHDPVLTLPPESEGRKNLAMIGIYKGYEDNFELDDEKTRFAFNTQCFESAIDTLSLCQFLWGFANLYGPKDLILLAKYGIDWDTSLYELMKIGERKVNMMRYFNAREGFTRDDDTLPERLFQPFKDGPSKGVSLDREKYEKSKELYYDIAGWDKETGNPTVGTLKRLSLGWLG
ncbi:aldehyde ferredoxin oxidoreductase family protein [Clostridium sp. Cult2]|uniref:aldehyde ferredoxin oxidoreductase family protein n=1 Tax=Clostridium sp. Cult2 TaxID=2079003 RepID=UPI001F34B0DF|nr:aldehyde ferredoxin oxidoreductase family protein [Clostridium sp. Cult2]MCF6466199.1 aldehyde:ferredoxin oxidoreductase [Clostridium sp. Cult2]